MIIDIDMHHSYVHKHFKLMRCLHRQCRNKCLHVPHRHGGQSKSKGLVAVLRRSEGIGHLRQAKVRMAGDILHGAASLERSLERLREQRDARWERLPLEWRGRSCDP